MKRLIYIAMMLFWLDNLVEGGPFISLLGLYFTHRFYKNPPPVAIKPVVAKVISIQKNASCDCLTHRLLGRIKMTA